MRVKICLSLNRLVYCVFIHSLTLTRLLTWLCMFVLSLCDCDYVLLYYCDLVIRSAGSQNIFFGGARR